MRPCALDESSLSIGRANKEKDKLDVTVNQERDIDVESESGKPPRKPSEESVADMPQSNPGGRQGHRGNSPITSSFWMERNAEAQHHLKTMHIQRRGLYADAAGDTGGWGGAAGEGGGQVLILQHLQSHDT